MMHYDYYINMTAHNAIESFAISCFEVVTRYLFSAGEERVFL